MPTMWTSSLSLNTRTDGASTTSRGSPFHTLGVLTVRKCFLASKRNLGSLSFAPLQRILPSSAGENSNLIVAIFLAACTDKELRNLASRLKDWFGALHEDANRIIKPTSSDSAQGRFDTSILPICKDSLGWMFNKLDMNYDLLLDHSEINAIYLDKYEPCIKPLFNSCDSFKDGKLSNNEWCYCFQKPGGLPCQNEMNRIQKLGKGKSLMGEFSYLPLTHLSQ
ncbi:Testican-1 [Varanus komodoensis]|nr:Testican-1 [Varanus komodoensis]